MTVSQCKFISTNKNISFFKCHIKLYLYTSNSLHFMQYHKILIKCKSRQLLNKSSERNTPLLRSMVTVLVKKYFFSRFFMFTILIYAFLIVFQNLSVSRVTQLAMRCCSGHNFFFTF